jgi:hypothetical protein
LIVKFMRCDVACVLGIEDEPEDHLASNHSGILEEVGRQVELRLSEAPHDPKKDPVDEASEESFPASDPPGWIWERPSGPVTKE